MELEDDNWAEAERKKEDWDRQQKSLSSSSFVRRSYQIAFGFFLLPVSALMLGGAIFASSAASAIVQYVGATMFAYFAFTSFFTWGRPYTTRIAFGVLSLSLFAGAVAIMFSDKPDLRPTLFCIVTGLVSGVYAITQFKR